MSGTQPAREDDMGQGNEGTQERQRGTVHVTTYPEARAAIAAQLHTLRRAAIGHEPDPLPVDPTPTEDDAVLALLSEDGTRDALDCLTLPELRALHGRFIARLEAAQVAAATYRETAHDAIAAASDSYARSGDSPRVRAWNAEAEHAWDLAREEASEASALFVAAVVCRERIETLSRRPGVASVGASRADTRAA